MDRRLIEDRQAELRRLAGRRRSVVSPGARQPRLSRTIARHAGLALVRAGRRLAGPDELLDRRVLLLSRPGTERH